MAKVLKIAAVVISIAAAIPTGGTSLLAAGLGVSAGVASAIAIGFSFAASIIAKPPSPALVGSQTQWKSDPNAASSIALGRTLVGGNVVYRRTHGTKNKYRTLVTTLSGCGPVDAVEATLYDKVTLSFAGQTTVSGKLHDRFWQVTQLGACPEAAALSTMIGYGPDRDASSKLSGYAAAIDTFLFDGEGKDTFTQMGQLGWVVRGVKHHDPRQDSTWPGGSGSCRIDDESTRVYSDTPQIAGLTFALGWHQGPNSIRVGGVGMPPRSIDIASFVEGANIAELNGWTVGGEISTGEDKWNALKTILQAGGAQPIRNGGTLSCMTNAPRVSIATIRRGDIIGDVSITTAATKRDRINGIIPNCRSESHGWEVVPAAVVRDASFLAEDGGPTTKEMTYRLVQCAAGQDPTQAAQLAAYDILNAREGGPIVLPLKLQWLGFKAGDCLTIDADLTELGWLAGKDVLVLKRQLDRRTGVVTLTVRTETASKHATALGVVGSWKEAATSIFDTPTLPDPEAGDWTLSATTIEGGGVTQPALEFAGTDPDRVAKAIRFAIYQGTSAPASDADWIPAGEVPVGNTPFRVTGIAASAPYVGSVQYVYRLGVSDRLVLSSVTPTGPSPAPSIRSAYYDVTGTLLTGEDASGAGRITVAGQVWDYPTLGTRVTRSGGTITGLDLDVTYYVYFDDPGLSGATPTYHATETYEEALNSADHPARHYLGRVATPPSGGTPATGGGGGGGYGCPCPHMLLRTRDGMVAAGELRPGTEVWGRHEISGAWGWYRVTAVRRLTGPAVAWQQDGSRFETSGSHLVADGDGWRRADSLPGAQPIGDRDVIAITVADAHTYLMFAAADAVAGVLSHNKLVNPEA